MTWKKKRITPLHLPLDPDGLTVDPELVVEVRLFRDAPSLKASPVFEQAPLTRLARSILPEVIGRGWHVRRVGQTAHCAIVLGLAGYSAQGAVLSAAPERVALGYDHTALVILPDRLIPARSWLQPFAFGTLADVLLGTRPRRRLRARPISLPQDDLTALASLA